MSFKETMQNLKSELSFQFQEAVKYTVPGLYQRHYEKKAKTVFGNLCADSALNGLRDKVIEHYLREAGHDPETDEPYQKVLGLNGGQSEYRDIVEKLSTPHEVKTGFDMIESNGPE